MNLHAIVAPYIAAVNPTIYGTLKVSAGPTTNADFSQTPTFAEYTNIPLQVQALTASDLRHLDALNIQGVMRKVYLNGNIEGLDRPAGKGGDILIFSGQTWLVTQVIEPWNNDGWTSVAVTLQNG